MRIKHKTTFEERTFLIESNAIEGVYDFISLKQAIKAWEYLMSQDSITTSVVMKTHKILMRYHDLAPDEKGQIRKCPVYIGRKEAMKHVEIDEALKRWCLETMKNELTMHAQDLHIQYESIHPFVDGNGRTGRMFYNWTRIKRLGEPVDIIYEQKKSEYYKWFK